MGFDDIIRRRAEIGNRICKSFSPDIEKAVAAIGEIRKWGGGDYKKVDSGKWVKVSDGKEKKISGTAMSSVVKEALDDLEEELKEERKRFESTIETKYTKGSTAYNIFFNSVWNDKNVDFIKDICSRREDLRKELEEIKIVIAKDQKERREKKAGKKEIDIEDLQPTISSFKSLFVDINKRTPRTGSAKRIYPTVGIDDYFLDTETTFVSILGKGVDDEEVEMKWDDMKNSSKFEHHKSPKSDSEYLVDKSNGDIYRFSDHWGRVASCEWSLNTDNEGVVRNIAKSNVKDFSRKDTGVYLNPKYTDEILEAGKIVLSKLKKLCVNNDKYYLTDKAKNMIKNYSNHIFRDVFYNADVAIEEVRKLKKKYEII